MIAHPFQGFEKAFLKGGAAGTLDGTEAVMHIQSNPQATVAPAAAAAAAAAAAGLAVAVASCEQWR